MRPIIFDFDGVIADSEYMVAAATAETLSEMGLPSTIKQCLEQYLGLSNKDSRLLIAEAFGGTLPEGFEAARHARVQEVIEVGYGPVAGVQDFLESLETPAPRQLGIASSSSVEWLRFGLKRFALSHYFGEHVYSAVGLPRAKPHPDVYLHAAASMQVDIKRCILIEDSQNGVRAGKAAGGLVIGLTAGSHMLPDSADKLKAVGADLIVGSYKELAEMIDELER